ncbi:MAG: LPS export ABC transporter permease LptF [Pseudomonadota bacterium]|nr:LPS export ABC transporter permease LptF [Pseudomonadota bacterium]
MAIVFDLNAGSPLVLLRYSLRQILAATAGISLVLMLVVLSSRFGRFLEDAAAGRLPADLVLTLLALRIPGMIELILPLGLFLGVLLTLGRMYANQEVTVLYACGVSPTRILGYVMLCALVLAVLVGVSTLWANPWGMRQAQAQLSRQIDVGPLQALTPGRFERDRSTGLTLYVQQAAPNGQFTELFVARTPNGPSNDASPEPLQILYAARGQVRSQDGQPPQYLELLDGNLYEGTPGSAAYLVTEFAALGLRLPPQPTDYRIDSSATRSTASLLQPGDPLDAAILAWRLSLPLMVPLVALLGFALARVGPRQGQFARFLPGMALYLVYLTLLSAMRDRAFDAGGGATAIWLVHVPFLALALWLNRPQRLRGAT